MILFQNYRFHNLQMKYNRQFLFSPGLSQLKEKLRQTGRLKEIEKHLGKQMVIN